MKLDEFMNNLNELIDERPELLDTEVVIETSNDAFAEVFYTPRIGVYDGKTFKEELDINIVTIDDINEEPSNVVCIN